MICSSANGGIRYGWMLRGDYLPSNQRTYLPEFIRKHIDILFGLSGLDINLVNAELGGTAHFEPILLKRAVYNYMGQ